MKLEEDCLTGKSRKLPESVLKSKDVMMVTQVHVTKAMVFQVVVYS